MKITKRQLRRLIKEAMDRFGRPIYTDQLGSYNPRSGELPPNPFVVADKTRARRGGDEMRQKGFSDGFNGEIPQEEDDDAYMQGYEEGQKASDSGDYELNEHFRKIINEVLGQSDVFPDLNHPLIKQYADEMQGPIKGRPGSWFTEYVTYKYNAGGASRQSIAVYLLPDGNYTARVGGSYNNTISGKIPKNFGDPESAIDAALNSSPGGRPPFAKDILKKVGEKVDNRGYFGQD